jgi:hypothetical protein
MAAAERPLQLAINTTTASLCIGKNITYHRSMGYKIRQHASWWARHSRKLTKTWQPLALLGIFVLGTTVGTLVAMQQHDVIASLTGAQAKDEQVAMITNGTESAQPGRPLSTKGNVQGLSVGTKAKIAGVRTTDCGTAAPMRGNMAKSSVPQLRKLVEYDAVCGNAVAGRVSFFVGTPKTAAQAKSEAQWVASVLNEIGKQGLGAVVFMEPSFEGQTLDAKQYQAGAYDAALDAYFAAIKANGVSDTRMGIWVPFPEANIPVWGSTDPATYIANVSRTVKAQKKYFPGSKAAVLLDSKSYPSGTSWEGGAYKSLLPYIANMPKGLIDSFGLQGFAWPPQYGEPAQLDPATFLPVNHAVEAAAALGVKDIWFNTGSYGRAARQNPAKPDVLTQPARQKVMDGIIAQAKVAQQKGYNVSIHLFAEDKFATPEAIDWSYWDKGQTDAQSYKAVYRTFVRDARASDIPLWIFDSGE